MIILYASIIFLSFLRFSFILLEENSRYTTSTSAFSAYKVKQFRLSFYFSLSVVVWIFLRRKTPHCARRRSNIPGLNRMCSANKTTEWERWRNL